MQNMMSYLLFKKGDYIFTGQQHKLYGALLPSCGQFLNYACWYGTLWVKEGYLGKKVWGY